MRLARGWRSLHARRWRGSGAIEAKFAACVELVGELEPGHAHLCPRSFKGYGHCRCMCDFEAREALRKLVEP